jgi:hypothetical protein
MCSRNYLLLCIPYKFYYTYIVQDVSAQVLDTLRKIPKVTLPAVNELASFLEQPIPVHMKIPILQHEFNSLVINDSEDSCTREDLEILFQINDIESSYYFTNKTLGVAILRNPPSREGTEYSFISFWDINIRFPLEHLIPDGISIRNSSKDMSTFGKWPDFGFILNRVCLFRGEEKSLINNEDLKAKLNDKLYWIYDPVPYILGKICTHFKIIIF